MERESEREKETEKGRGGRVGVKVTGRRNVKERGRRGGIRGRRERRRE